MGLYDHHFEFHVNHAVLDLLDNVPCAHPNVHNIHGILMPTRLTYAAVHPKPQTPSSKAKANDTLRSRDYCGPMTRMVKAKAKRTPR
jgi:hypothetical protein